MKEAQEFYRRAVDHEGEQRARAAFEAGAARAGMHVQWEER
jgi:hypothetical protein